MAIWATELFGLGAISAQARTSRLLEAVGILLLLLGIYGVMRFWARAAKWKKEGLFTRPVPRSETLEQPVASETALENESETEESNFVAVSSGEHREMSRNRKD